jgi:hypothetical protein
MAFSTAWLVKTENERLVKREKRDWKESVERWKESVERWIDGN